MDEIEELAERVLEVSREINRLASEETDEKKRAKLIRMSKKASMAKRGMLGLRDILRANQSKENTCTQRLM